MGYVVGVKDPIVAWRRRQLQVSGLDETALCQDHRSFDDVFQLPDVSRERMVPEHGHSTWSHPPDLLPDLLGALFQKVAHQERQVALPFPKGRNMDRNDIQPVVQVFPEGAFAHHLLEVPVGGGDEANIDGDRFRVANRGDHHLLEDAQQLGLNGRADVGHLVQEQGSSVSHLEQTFFGLDRTCK